MNYVKNQINFLLAEVWEQATFPGDLRDIFAQMKTLQRPSISIKQNFLF